MNVFKYRVNKLRFLIILKKQLVIQTFYYSIFKNDILVLEINNYGLLKNKKFYNKEDMEKIKIVNVNTETEFQKNSFIYNFMSSMRQKINDPLGQRAKKRKKINQR